MDGGYGAGVDSTVDLEGLHWYLWEHRDARDLVVITGKDLADKLQIARSTATKVLKAMVAAGRLQEKAARSTYSVVDPASVSGSPGSE